jgi:hypothetical protein
VPPLGGAPARRPAPLEALAPLSALAPLGPVAALEALRVALGGAHVDPDRLDPRRVLGVEERDRHSRGNRGDHGADHDDPGSHGPKSALPQ